MPSIPDLPDDSLYLVDQVTCHAFVSGACPAETVTELLIENADKPHIAAFVVVDFTWQPDVLTALRCLPEASISGHNRWSWLEVPTEGSCEAALLWRCDITVESDDAVAFAIIGEATPQIEALLTGADLLLLAAEHPLQGEHILEKVLVVLPALRRPDPAGTPCPHRSAYSRRP